MALPTTIVSDVGLAGHHPPRKSSTDNFYSVVRADADELDVYKATDPEDSWTLQGTGPVHVGTILGFATYQDGDVIHIVAWSDETYEYYTFNMATDAWVIDELMETTRDAPLNPWASIAVRSDGDVIVAYAGDTDKVMGKVYERVDYARREGGTWTVGVALDAGGAFMYGNPTVVKGPLTDDMHIIWQEAEVDPVLTTWAGSDARTLDPSNSLSTVISDATIQSGGALLGFGNGVSYDDSGTQRISWPYTSGAALTAGRATEDASDDIQSLASSLVTLLDPEVNADEVGIITYGELNGDLHCLWGGDSGLDRDLFYSTSTDNGVNWPIPDEEIDGVTINFISANIYIRGIDTVMAYVYDDGGVQKYNEKVLIAGQTHQIML